MDEKFQAEVESILAQIGSEKLKYNEDEVWMYQRVYDFVWEYACEHHFLNTALALPVVRSLHNGTYRGSRVNAAGEKCRRPYFCHSLSVCRMLINLHPQLTPEEEDIALASALCHDLMVYVHFPERGNEMTTVYHLDYRVPRIMRLIYEGDCETDEDYRNVFEQVQGNKLALLVRLSDRGNIVEELYDRTTWKAHELIYETRTYYIPMCIYAREHFPELDTAIGVLQEKLRDLIQATDIFVTRYENREKELAEQILALQEENARMRSVIRQKQEQRRQESQGDGSQ